MPKARVKPVPARKRKPTPARPARGEIARDPAPRWSPARALPRAAAKPKAAPAARRTSAAKRMRLPPIPGGATEKARPPREAATARKARMLRVLAELKALYPDANCALEHRSAFELVAATILSAQCTDARVNLVT